MAKNKSVFTCTNCGTEHSKWMGQCQGCKEWNTLTEEIQTKRNLTQEHGAEIVPLQNPQNRAS